MAKFVFICLCIGATVVAIFGDADRLEYFARHTIAFVMLQPARAFLLFFLGGSLFLATYYFGVSFYADMRSVESYAKYFPDSSWATRRALFFVRQEAVNPISANSVKDRDYLLKFIDLYRSIYSLLPEDLIRKFDLDGNLLSLHRVSQVYLVRINQSPVSSIIFIAHDATIKDRQVMVVDFDRIPTTETVSSFVGSQFDRKTIAISLEHLQALQAHPSNVSRADGFEGWGTQPGDSHDWAIWWGPHPIQRCNLHLLLTDALQISPLVFPAL